MRDCIFRDNRAGSGGAAWFEGRSEPLMLRCDVRNNIAGGIGGGVATDLFADVTLRDCVIEFNRSSSGGGVCLCASGGVVEGCTISRNTATFGGGLAMLSCIGVRLSESSIVGNLAGASGGGVYASDSDYIVLDSLVSNNASHGSGGAAWMLGSEATFERSSVLANDSTSSPGGLLLDGSMLLLTGGRVSGNGVAIACVSGSGAEADARGNWWGHASGPLSDRDNPEGLGNEVGECVLFDPWLVIDAFEKDRAELTTSWTGLKRMDW